MNRNVYKISEKSIIEDLSNVFEVNKVSDTRLELKSKQLLNIEVVIVTNFFEQRGIRVKVEKYMDLIMCQEVFYVSLATPLSNSKDEDFDYMYESSLTDVFTDEMVEKIIPKNKMRLLQGCLGLNTEQAEITDKVKKHVFQGADLDYTKLLDELGDVMWYSAQILRAINTNLKTNYTFEDVQKINIAKIRTRYGTSFSNEKSNNRDLEKETSAVELKIYEQNQK